MTSGERQWNRIKSNQATRLQHILRVLFEAIADIFVGDACVFPEETDDLAAAAGLEIEVVEGIETWDEKRVRPQSHRLRK